MTEYFPGILNVGIERGYVLYTSLKSHLGNTQGRRVLEVGLKDDRRKGFK